MSNSRNFILFCVAIGSVFGVLNSAKQTFSSTSAATRPVTPVLSQVEASAKRVRDEEERRAQVAARKAQEEAEAETCKGKWQACADNADLAGHYRRFYLASVVCEKTANALAKYGDPKWEWVPFMSHLKGNDAPRTGIITMTDDHVS